jgi:uncharacterized repeat protein (TIGR02543 family)
VNWSRDASGTANPLDVTMDHAKRVTANFAVNEYALDVAVAGSGTVTRNPDQTLYDHGTEVILTAEPASGSTFVGWTGDAAGSDNPLTVTMNAAKAITAVFGSTSVSSADKITEVALAPIAPNPSSGSVHIAFALPGEARARLSVLDVQGRECAVLTNGEQSAGRHSLEWSGRSERGPAPPGLYFVRLVASGRTLVRRLVITR